MTLQKPTTLPFGGETRSEEKVQGLVYSAMGKWRKLEKKSYREGYVQAQKAVGLAFQIGALRKSKGWTEGELADRCGWSKDRQIEIETVGGDELTWETLQALASAFDIGIMVKFASFGEMVEAENSFDPNTFDVLGFNEDGLRQTKPKRLKSAQVDSVVLKLVSNVAEEKAVSRASRRTLKSEKAFYDFHKRLATREQSLSGREYGVVLRPSRSGGR